MTIIAHRRIGSIASRLGALILAACVLAPQARAQATPATVPAAVPLDRIMSPADREAAGLARLAPAERAALEAWLARYTETVISVTRAATAEADRDRMSSARATATVARSVVPGQYLVAAEERGAPDVSLLRAAVAPAVTQVVRVLDDGALIELADGTTWEILVDDRARTAGWRAGESVRVRSLAAPADRRYDLQLENVSGGWRVAARPVVSP